MTPPPDAHNTPTTDQGAGRRSRYHLDRTTARPYALAHIAQGLAILVALDRLGPLTNGQVRDLLFLDMPNTLGAPRTVEGARKAANTACQRLWENGFVTRQTVILTSRETGGPYHHFVNLLTAHGARQVAAHYEEQGGTLRWTRTALELKPLQVEHSLAINDVHILIARAARLAGLTFGHWQDDRQLALRQRAGETRFVNTPDAFFVLGHGERTLGHFLEYDRGTETIIASGWGRRDWRGKVTGYGQYFGGWEQVRPLFADVAVPIVLTVTTTATRLANLLAATRRAGGGGRYWYTTEGELFSGDPATFWEPIWRVCTDPAPRSLKDRLTPTSR